MSSEEINSLTNSLNIFKVALSEFFVAGMVSLSATLVTCVCVGVDVLLPGVVWAESSESLPWIYRCLRLIVVALTFLYPRAVLWEVLFFLCLRVLFCAELAVSPLSVMIVSAMLSISISVGCIVLRMQGIKN